nr:MAG TPA: hypothetical protein [Caudoviricetes sp.]
MLDYPFYRRNPCQLLWRKRRSYSKGRRIKRPLRRRLHHYIKNSSRTGIREPGLCHSENKPVLTVASERRKVKENGAGSSFSFTGLCSLKSSIKRIRDTSRGAI